MNGPSNDRALLTRRDFVSGAVVAFVVAALIGLLVFAVLTQANTNTVVHDVANAQAYHATTLESIARVDERVKTEISQLKKATMQVDAIFAEAGKVSAQLEASQHLICQAVHANC